MSRSSLSKAVPSPGGKRRTHVSHSCAHFSTQTPPAGAGARSSDGGTFPPPRCRRSSASHPTHLSAAVLPCSAAAHPERVSGEGHISPQTLGNSFNISVVGSVRTHQTAQVRTEERRRGNNKTSTAVREIGNTVTALLAAVAKIRSVTAPGNTVELKSGTCPLPVIQPA